jgi:hypothetical protein
MPEPHPWFEPFHRRVATLAVCVVWLGFELWQGTLLWLMLASAATGYAVWELFLSGRYGSSQTTDTDRRRGP